MARVGKVKRETKETKVSIRIDLDGKGRAKVATGIGFLNHLLETLTLHGGFDLEVEAEGDLRHHVVEDVAICLGQALREAMGKRKEMRRFGYAIVAMEDALVLSSIDLAGRPYARVALGFNRETLEDVASEDLNHFLRTLASSAVVTLHVEALHGENDHHKAEAALKSIAISLREALSPGSRGYASSLKGVL